MIYSYEDTLKIFLKIYEYLQVNATREMPCSVKMNKPRHRTVVISFLEKLPPSAGADFIWDFLTFQFYIYSQQVHDRRPMPSWFIGKEAWIRWRDYEEGSRWHAREWVSLRKLKNPVKLETFTSVSKKALRDERLRMSRISGPNFCGMKYGENPFDKTDIMCIKCPFYKDCETLFGTPNEDGKNLFQEIQNVAQTLEEKEQLIGHRVNVRQKTHFENYGDE